MVDGPTEAGRLNRFHPADDGGGAADHRRSGDAHRVRAASLTSALGIEQRRAQLLALLIAEPHVTGRQLDPSLGGTVRLLSPADPQADAQTRGGHRRGDPFTRFGPAGKALVTVDVCTGDASRRSIFQRQEIPRRNQVTKDMTG
jgi:hypothetical protein